MNTHAPPRPVHELWSSEFAFIMAALGSAVGLGNIWRFPYLVGEHGGGAFVLLYLLFVAAIGLPALIATIMVGRRGQRSPIACFAFIAAEEGHSPRWAGLGWLLVLSAYLLLTFFSVVASWTFDYLSRSLTDGFAGIDAAASRTLFDTLKADPLRMALWHGVFMGITVYVVALGIRRGIERTVKWMMPALFGLLLVLLCYSLVAGDVTAALHFLFRPDFARLDAHAVLLCVGQVLLSLSVGGAGMVVYGAYMKPDSSIPRAAGVIAVVDTLVAVLAGLIIFPVVFAHGLEAAAGPGLIFVTLPVAFGQIPGGPVFAVMFFALLLLAAQTTAFSMFEPVVAWLAENRGMSRVRAALLAGVVAWAIGLVTVFSFSIWSAVRPLDFIARFSDLSIFRIMEYVVTSIAMPLGALLVSVFVGHVVLEKTRRNQFGDRHAACYASWRFSARWIVPLGLLAMFVFNLW